MMNFGLLVAAIIVGILLATVVTTAIMIALITNKKVMKAYMNWVMKMSAELTNELLDVDEEDEE